MEFQNEWRRSANVVRVPPRSIYSESTEADAWKSAMRMAQGRIHPTYVFANRRILGLTVGRGVYSLDVAVHRFRHGTSWVEMEMVRADMLRCAFPDTNDVINSLTTLQFGRTYFGKNAVTTSVADNWHDLWPVTGNPQSGAINNTAFTATQFTDTTVGAIFTRGNVSPSSKHLLSRWALCSANTLTVMLYDRVLAYDQCTFNANSNKTLTNVLAAQRYVSGAPGLLISCVVGALGTSATASNLTQLRYTDQDGNALQSMPTTRTITFIPSVNTPTATLGARLLAPSTSGSTTTWGAFLPLSQGDTGAQLINDFTTSAAPTGNMSFVLLHPLTDLILPVSAIPSEVDNIFQVEELAQIYDGACLAFMAFMTPATAFNLQGCLKYGWS